MPIDNLTDRWDNIDDPPRYDEGSMRSNELKPVEVMLHVDLRGNTTPTAIIVGGRQYALDACIRRRTERGWTRYDVRVGHHERWLWNDGTRWYVQRRQG